jgi:hypothetical protein
MFAALVGGLAVDPLTAAAQAPSPAIHLAPHRAVYDIQLTRASPGSGVAEMSGRMVFELSGSTCEGYTQNMRFVTRMTNQEGTDLINDLRTSSWEEALGKRLRFNSSQYQNDVLTESTQGDAERSSDEGPVKVEIARPAKKKLTIKDPVYFPVQHSKALIAAARAGKTMFSADLYDGSEKGEKVYNTVAVIGRPVAPGATKMPASIKNVDRLKTLPSWPVSVSYFEKGNENRDAVPVYEMSYRFYENGVTTKLNIDYGEFAIRADLAELTFVDGSTCREKP